MSSLYFDNAATSFPKPRCVYNAVASALVKCAGNPGRSTHKEAERSAKAVFEARESVCKYFGCASPNNVFFTQNATTALNTAILGVKINSGAVLISDIEHNAVLRPVAERCRREKTSFKIFKTFPDDIERTVDSFASELSDNICCVAINAASNVDGRVLPIREIGELCKLRNIPLIIDASQLAGHRKIDMSSLNCSILCCAGHKGLMSPMGCGFGILGDIEAEFLPLLFGGNGINSKSIYVGDETPERFESGTLGVPCIAGLCSGIDYLENAGSAWYETEKRNTDMIVNGLNKIDGASVFHSIGGVPVISFSHPFTDCEEIASFLANRGIAVRSGFHCAPLAHNSIGTYERGTLRISPSAYNSIEDCEYLLKCIKCAIQKA